MVIQIVPNAEKTPNTFAQALLGGVQGYQNARQQQAQQLSQSQQEQQKQNFLRQMQQEKYGFEGKQSQEKQMQDFLNQVELQKQKFGFQKELEEGKPKVISKEESEKEDQKRVMDVGQKSFDRMSELLKSNRLGRGSGFLSMFGGQTGKDVGEFTALTGGLESMLVDMVSRGTLSNTRFDYIKNTLLPNPGDPDDVIEGKLKGLAQILNLDASSLIGNKELKKSGQMNEKMSLGDIW
jgi:hypothetical protein